MKQVLSSNAPLWGSARKDRYLPAVLALVVLATLGSIGNVHAAAVCPPDQTLTDGDHVECTKNDATDISISLSGVDIDTTANLTPAVSASHTGTGNVTIDVSTQSELTTTGAGSHGISGTHTGNSGNVNVRVNGSTIEAGIEGEAKSAYGITAGRGVADASLPLGGQTGDLSLSLTSSSVTAHSANAILAQQYGTGKLDILLDGTSTLTTTGTSVEAVRGQHVDQCPAGSGSSCYARIRSQNGVTIMAPGARSTGIILARVQRPGQTHLSTDGIIEVTGNTITTGGFGIFNSTEGVRPGNVRTTVTDTRVTTTGEGAYGVTSARSDTGDQAINLVCTGSSTVPCRITTQGALARGVLGEHAGAASSGTVRIDLRGAYAITTQGADGIGIQASNGGTGDVRVNVQGGSITTSGDRGHGILGWRSNIDQSSTGDIDITTQNHAIETTSTSEWPDQSYGIWAVHANSGTIRVNSGSGSSIRTAGPFAHGIVAYHGGGADADTRRIDITVGSPINVTGMRAQGVSVGAITDGAPVQVAARGADGFLQQTVRVNDAITSAAEGIFLAGGGRVIIGPRGSINSGSNIAIWTTGTVPEDSSDVDNVIAAIPPRLRVDLNPGGRRIAQVLNGGWIINDGGETTIAVNNVVLHDGTEGATDNTARNGIWNVTMLSSETIADRNFSEADFTEIRRPTPPPMCEEGQTGTPPDCMDPDADPDPDPDPGTTDPDADPDPDSSEPSGPMIIEDYAPRAALYEALPEFLLGLHTQTDSAAHRLSAALPLWLEVSGHSGEHDPQDSTVGTGYDTGHRVAALGGTLVHNEHWNVQASVHRVSGSAEVSSAVKGGDIEAEGRGISLQARWSPGGGPYASGRIAWTDYALDLDSDDAAVGRLVSSVGAERLALQLEAGHRLPWGTRSFLTPQVGVSHTQVDIDGFTDATGARAAFRDTERSSARLGVRADTTTTGVALYGAVHLAHHLETGTTADVSGERLRARTPDHDLHLALGAQWQTGPWILQAGLGARHALGSDSHAYSGNLRVGVPF